MISYEDSNFILQIKEQPWDSSIFGFKCGYFTINGQGKSKERREILDRLISEILKKAKTKKYKFLTVKINAEKIHIVNACFKNSGKLIDTELTFHKYREDSTSKKINLPKDFLVQKHEAYWDDSLRGLSKTIGYSRFFMDKNISQEMAQNIWEKSIYNSCNGRATYSVFCFYQEKPVGLINVFEKNSISDIFLIALLPGFQNQGLGKLMLNYYEANLSETIREQTVETQLINYGAQNFYAKMGYKNIKTKQIIHFWL